MTPSQRVETEITIGDSQVRISARSEAAVKATVELVRCAQMSKIPGGAFVVRSFVRDEGLIATIRWLRTFYNYGLREAKELVDAVQYGES